MPILRPEDLKNIEKAVTSADRVHRASPLAGPRSFALVVNDKSNDPFLKIGDTCVFDPDVKAEPGKYVLALVGRERQPMIRLLTERENHFALIPKNSAWGPKALSSKKDGEIVATLIEFTRSV